GFVDGVSADSADASRSVPYLGPGHELVQLVEASDVERVVFSQIDDEDAALRQIRALQDRNVQVDVVPRLPQVIGPGVSLFAVEGLPLAGLSQGKLGRLSLMIKRAFDLALAFVVLVVTLPLFAFIAWRIRRESPGPVFFRQDRLGRNMRRFTMLKFR